VREDSEREDEPAAAHESHAVVASKARDTVRVVEEAINARVVQLLGRITNEKVTVEPTKLAQHFVARDRTPNVNGNQDLQRGDIISTREELQRVKVRGLTVPAVTRNTKRKSGIWNSDIMSQSA
jgi:hypothetical protein